MKKFLLVLLLFLSLTSFAQMQVKENSFRKIDGFVMLDKNDHYDDNNLPMALIKISTENITAEERRRITFKVNLATYFDVHFEPSEIYLYLSAKVATFIEIHHPDYGKTEFTLPFDLEDFCGYEMVLQNVGKTPMVLSDLSIGVHELRLEKNGYESIVKKFSVKYGEPLVLSETLQVSKSSYLAINSNPLGADIYIDGAYKGKTPDVYSDLTFGKHEIKLEKEGFSTSLKIIEIKEGETLVLNETMQTGRKISISNDIDNVAHYKDSSREQTNEVMTKQPNEIGVYDMSGNVWELLVT